MLTILTGAIVTFLNAVVVSVAVMVFITIAVVLSIAAPKKLQRKKGKMR